MQAWWRYPFDSRYAVYPRYPVYPRYAFHPRYAVHSVYPRYAQDSRFSRRIPVPQSLADTGTNACACPSARSGGAN